MKKNIEHANFFIYHTIPHALLNQDEYQETFTYGQAAIERFGPNDEELEMAYCAVLCAYCYMNDLRIALGSYERGLRRLSNGSKILPESTRIQTN